MDIWCSSHGEAEGGAQLQEGPGRDGVHRLEKYEGTGVQEVVTNRAGDPEKGSTLPPVTLVTVAQEYKEIVYMF